MGVFGKAQSGVRLALSVTSFVVLGLGRDYG
jgi:hypothetical protein